MASPACVAVVSALVLVLVLRSPAGRPAYGGALVLLIVTGFIYPVVFGLQGVTTGGAEAVTGQLLLCVVVVAAMVAHGLLIQWVAKLSTTFHVQAGLLTHSETSRVAGLRQSKAMRPEARR